MAGAVVMVIVLLLIPVVVALSGALVAAGLGWFLERDADRRHAGSELLETNI
jgi:hypothetical protein